jgi:hypothetical protein
MATEQVKPEGLTVYNFDKVGSETDKPVRILCHRLYDSIQPAIQDKLDLGQAYWSVKEVIKDMDTHADPEYPRLLVVTRTLGETILRVVDMKRPNDDYDDRPGAVDGLPAEKGFGGAILKDFDRVEYSEIVTPTDDGDLHMGILRIKHDKTYRPQLN